MQARDWFGVAVRTIGLWLLVLASEYALGTLDRVTHSEPRGMLTGERPATDVGLKGYVFFTLGYAGLGFFLLLRAEHVVAWAYAGRSNAERPDERTDEAHDAEERSDG